MGTRSWALRRQRARESAYPSARAHPPAGPPSAAQERRESATEERQRQSAARCAADPAPAARTGWHPIWPRPAGLFRLGCGGSQIVTVLFISRPGPGHLLRSGAFSLPKPLRRSSAHVSAMSGAVAVAASSRHCRMQPTADRTIAAFVCSFVFVFVFVCLCCCCYCYYYYCYCCCYCCLCTALTTSACMSTTT